MTWLRSQITNEIVQVFHVQEECTIHISQKGSTYEKEPKPTKKKSQSDTPAAPVFMKKENATLAQHIEILDWHHKNGQNQSEMAHHFDSIYPNLKIK